MHSSVTPIIVSEERDFNLAVAFKHGLFLIRRLIFFAANYFSRLWQNARNCGSKILFFYFWFDKFSTHSYNWRKCGAIFMPFFWKLLKPKHKKNEQKFKAIICLALCHSRYSFWYFENWASVSRVGLNFYRIICLKCTTTVTLFFISAAISIYPSTPPPNHNKFHFNYGTRW